MQDTKINELQDVQNRLYKRLAELEESLDEIPDKNSEQRRKRLDLVQKLGGTIVRISAILVITGNHTGGKGLSAFSRIMLSLKVSD